MSLPVIAWITVGVRRQLETHAQAEGIPVEMMAGELITDHLRALGLKPVDPVPADIVTAQYRTRPDTVIEHVRSIMQNENPTRGMAIHRNARKLGKIEGAKP